MLTEDDFITNYVGAKVRCIANTSGSQLTIGDIYYIKTISGGPTSRTVYVSKTPKGPAYKGWGYAYEFEKVATTIEELTLEIKKLEKEKKGLDNKIIRHNETIALMQKLGLKEIDEDLIKTYKIMQKLNLGNLEDAKMVVAILKS